ncbi:hypothetical protein CEXT_348861 [Caerostris extrusa]|uniref:Uncharacterized protein n=1 Tax=Caerostris extrusa TaxID=172846 RepID=A0AAV4XPE9_CAEEX|nr:hypothetical protein CEXT_348861 [Caerostris extrusa]
MGKSSVHHLSRGASLSASPLHIRPFISPYRLRPDYSSGLSGRGGGGGWGGWEAAAERGARRKKKFFSWAQEREDFDGVVLSLFLRFGG